MSQEWKFLRIKKELHDELTNLGSKSESYNDIVQRILEFYKENNKKEVDSIDNVYQLITLHITLHYITLLQKQPR